MHVVVFEDEGVERLYPITTGRPAYAITCAGYRLIDWLAKFSARAQGWVRPHLASLQRHDFPEVVAPADTLPAGEACLLVNARLTPAASVAAALEQLTRQERAAAVYHHDQLAAAWWPAGARQAPWRRGEVARCWQAARRGSVAEPDLRLPLFDFPHEVIGANQRHFAENLEHRLRVGDYREIAPGVFAAAGAELGQHVVSDTRQGPVVLEADARVGPFCYLRGPALIGRGARVNEHAAVKDFVVLGHTTKVGGEVEASIIEPYSNKQHHGFLGHSYLGSWINLGAGTCNSDLKNTYGPVKMEYRGHKVDTGMQFVGCVMGDYAKSAINTGVFTGKTIGVCSMLYGFVTTNVPSFVNYARLFGQVAELPPEVMISTQQRMFARRKVTQRPCDIELIHDMYKLTEDERRLAGEPLSL